MTHRLPYPGLRAFRSDEADLFFGRDRALDSMIETLARTRFLAVIGSSGSGKSSLVRTGLLQSLRIGHYHKAGSTWRVADMHPGGRPLYNLAAALLAAAEGPAEMADADVLAAYLARAPRSIINWVEAGNVPAGSNLLILADQFEELFRYANYAEREEAEAFTRLLLECRAAPEELGIHVVLTMRSEFLGACTLLPGLGEAINDGLFLTPRMTREECQEAIEGPAMMLDFEIEPRLVNRILNDLANFAPWERNPAVDQLEQLSRRADQLPLMQHTLNRLWQAAAVEAARIFYEGWDATAAEEPPPIVLTHDQYERIGGLRGALNAHAEELVAALSPEAQRLVPTIFKALVDGPSVADAVRRPCTVAELVALANGDWTRVSAVLDAFRAPDGNFLRPALPAELDNDTIIDLTHESLIRQWDSLAVWVEEDAASAATWHRLMSGQARHRDGKADLLVGLELANCRSWWDAAQPTGTWAERHGGRFLAVKRYLDDSIEADDERRATKAQRRTRDRRRVKVFVSVLAVLTVFSSASAFYAVQLNDELETTVQQLESTNHNLISTVQERSLYIRERSELIETLNERNEELESAIARSEYAERQAQERLQDMSGWLQQISDIIREQDQRPILGFDETERRLFNVLDPFQQYLLEEEPGVVSPIQIAQTLFYLGLREERSGNAEGAMDYYRRALDEASAIARAHQGTQVPSTLVEIIVESAVNRSSYLMILRRTDEAGSIIFSTNQLIDSLQLDHNDGRNIRSFAMIANAISRIYLQNGDAEQELAWARRALEFASHAYELDPHDFTIQRTYLSYLHNLYGDLPNNSQEEDMALQALCSLLDRMQDESVEFFFVNTPAHRTCRMEIVSSLFDSEAYSEAREILLQREHDLRIYALFSPENIAVQAAHLRSISDIIRNSGYRGDDPEFRAEWLQRAIDRIEAISSSGAILPIETYDFEFAIEDITSRIADIEDEETRIELFSRTWAAISETTLAYPQLARLNLSAGRSARQVANILLRSDRIDEVEIWLDRAEASYRQSAVFQQEDPTDDVEEACSVFGDFVRLRLHQRRFVDAISYYSQLSDNCGPALDRYPWDFYLRQHFMSANMRIGEALLLDGQADIALPYLEYASHWGVNDSTLHLAQIYREGLAGSIDLERAQELEALASRQSIKRFTVPVTVPGGGVWNFYVYIRELPEDYPYEGIDDQVIWAQEMRGLTISEDIARSFRRLHQIARENNVSFPDLCVYALGEASNNPTGAESEGVDPPEPPEDGDPLTAPEGQVMEPAQPPDAPVEAIQPPDDSAEAAQPPDDPSGAIEPPDISADAAQPSDDAAATDEPPDVPVESDEPGEEDVDPRAVKPSDP
ncbi:MAG: DUF2610 domain-containing protein [Rhodospirillaceae bacterium]|nr:DUF2610 domain-containing protein [Rhodospirillaceae bacterium]